MSEVYNDPLPFSEKRQLALLGHLLSDNERQQQFFMQARSLIKPDWFVDHRSQIVWKIALQFFESFNRQPSFCSPSSSSSTPPTTPAPRAL